MPCRTRLYAGLNGRVVQPSSAGSLGSAYGPWAFRIRNQHFDRDFVIGHVRKVFVRPGERVTRGQLIARASDAGAPDGCHLHFEARPIAGSYSSAVRPNRFLQLTR
jgi:murein DD-endopeptidase MepM/ murein hydrolase activator NlpD